MYLGAATIKSFPCRAHLCISGNTFGIGLDKTGGGTASVMVERTNVSENTGNGIQVTGTSTAAVLHINNSAIEHNATGVNITAASDVRSYKNNVISQNATANVTGNLVTNLLQ